MNLDEERTVAIMDEKNENQKTHRRDALYLLLGGSDKSLALALLGITTHTGNLAHQSACQWNEN